MRVGRISGKEVVSIVDIGEAGFYLVRFNKPSNKLGLDKLPDSTPWGYDGLRVFLPLDVIEKKISDALSAIEFIG